MHRTAKVWVVDDDSSIRWVLERALNQAGIENESFADADLLLAGWSNRLLDAHGQRLKSISESHGKTLLLAGKEFDSESHSVALMAARGERHLGFISAADAAAIPSLARKLPHYGSYGMLVFDASGQNRLKQSAPVTDSRLTHHFTREETPLQLPPRKPLID